MGKVGSVGGGWEWLGVPTISVFRFLNKNVQILGHDTVSFWVRYRIFLPLGEIKVGKVGKNPNFL